MEDNSQLCSRDKSYKYEAQIVIKMSTCHCARVFWWLVFYILDVIYDLREK